MLKRNVSVAVAAALALSLAACGSSPASSAASSEAVSAIAVEYSSVALAYGFKCGVCCLILSCFWIHHVAVWLAYLH